MGLMSNTRVITRISCRKFPCHRKKSVFIIRQIVTCVLSCKSVLLNRWNIIIQKLEGGVLSFAPVPSKPPKITCWCYLTVQFQSETNVLRYITQLFMLE